MSVTQDLAGQVKELLGSSAQARVNQYLNEAKSKEQKMMMEETAAARKSFEEQKAAAKELLVEKQAAALAEQQAAKEKPGEVSQASPKKRSRKMLYLAYNYYSPPPYVEQFKDALQKCSYLVFNPLASVEEQFNEEHRESIYSLESKHAASVLNFYKLPEELSSPLKNAKVIERLRRGDQRVDSEAMMFKELYFLVRSSLVVADLSHEPYSPDLYHKLFHAKLLGIPTIGVGPAGRSLNPYVQKMVKVVLTEEFNFENIAPLISAYVPLD